MTITLNLFNDNIATNFWQTIPTSKNIHRSLTFLGPRMDTNMTFRKETKNGYTLRFKTFSNNL